MVSDHQRNTSRFLPVLLWLQTSFPGCIKHSLDLFIQVLLIVAPWKKMLFEFVGPMHNKLCTRQYGVNGTLLHKLDVACWRSWWNCCSTVNPVATPSSLVQRKLNRVVCQTTIPPWTSTQHSITMYRLHHICMHSLLWFLKTCSSEQTCQSRSPWL